MKAVKGVVFDLEDTLYDKSDWVIPAIEYAANQFGLDSTRTTELLYEYCQRPGGMDANVYNYVLLGCGQFDTAMNVRALCAWANQYQPNIGSLQLFPGTEKALEIVCQKHKLAVVAEGPVDCQRMIISALRLEPIIPSIVYSDEIEGVRSRRPDSRGVLQAIRLLGLQNDEVLWVADNPAKDFIEVRQYGVTTVRVLTGGCATLDPPSIEHAADYNISSVARLPALITELKEEENNLSKQQDQPRFTTFTTERRV